MSLRPHPEGSLPKPRDIRPRSRPGRLRDYARVFSWRQLLLFELVDLLGGLRRRPTLRRARALRRFSRVVPPQRLTVEGRWWRFEHEIAGRPVTLRLRRDSSDPAVFLQVVVDREYAPVLGTLAGAEGPPRVVDAGANIGLTTLWLSCLHPDARILALEPMPENFACLQRCVEENGLGNVTLLEKGLWTEDTRLAPERGFRDGAAWSFALREPSRPGEAGIAVTSLESLLAEADWTGVDLLKIDIEGSEAKLIRDPAFLRTVDERVRLVAMEVHAEAVGRDEVRAAFHGLGWRSLAVGETLLAWSPGVPVGGGA